MFNLIISVWFFTAICYSHVRYCEGTIQEVNKSYTFDDQLLFDRGDSFNEGIYVYVLCDSDTGKTTNCKVIQMKYPYEEISHTCAVTFETLNGRPDVGVSALGKEKAILYWTHTRDGSLNTSVSTVDLRSCEFSRAINIRGYSHLTFFELVYLSKVVWYSDGSFDLFYQDPRYHPEEAELYKMQISGDGKMKTQPTAVNVERGHYYYTFSVAKGSPSKGYVYVKRNQKNFSKNATTYLLLVKPDGTRLQLAQYNRFDSDISVGNNLINLCYKAKTESRVTCNQYDENGNVKFSTNFHIGENVDSIQTYSLPNGGMLVMYGTKECNQPDNCHNTFKVMKIGSDGSRVGIMQLFKVDIVNNRQVVAPHIYENESGVYYVTIIKWEFPMSSEVIPSNLTMLSKCFTVYDMQTYTNSDVLGKFPMRQD